MTTGERWPERELAMVRAAESELLDRGIRAFSVHRVAQAIDDRSAKHASPAAPREALIVATLTRLTATTVRLPTELDLHADLVAYAEAADAALDADPRLAALLRELATLSPEEHDRVGRPFWRHEARRATALIERAALRREIPSTRHAGRMLETVMAPVLLRSAMGAPRLPTVRLRRLATDAVAIAFT